MTDNHVALLRKSVPLDDGVVAVRCWRCGLIGALSRRVQGRAICVVCDRVGMPSPPAPLPVGAGSEFERKPIVKEEPMDDGQKERGTLSRLARLVSDEAEIRAAIEELEGDRAAIVAELGAIDTALSRLRLLAGEEVPLIRKKRRFYSAEQKAELIRLVKEEGVPLAQAAESLGFSSEKTAYRIVWEHQKGIVRSRGRRSAKP